MPFFHCLCVHRGFLGGPHSHWWEPHVDSVKVQWIFRFTRVERKAPTAPTQGELRRVKPPPMKGRILRISGRTSHPYLLPQESKQHPSSEIISQRIALLESFNFSIFFNAPFLFFQAILIAYTTVQSQKKIQLNSSGRLKKTSPPMPSPEEMAGLLKGYEPPLSVNHSWK